DIYAAVDSCETAQEIWLRVQQIMKGSDIRIQEKKAKLFNEWERFTSIDGKSIESYYHRFSKLMNDFKRNKHVLEKIANNLKFLNNLQLEWIRHVTIIHQTKDLHIVDYTKLYDFLKYNQKEVDDLRAERLAKTQDPLALMENSNNPFNYPVFHPDLPSSSTLIQQPLSNNNYNPQPSFSQNYMQQHMPDPEDITNPTAAMNMTLILMAKAFKLNYSTPTNNNQRISSNPRNRQIAQLGIANLNRNGNVVAARVEGNANGNNDGSAKVKLHDNCYDDEIFNMFTQEEQYTKILEPIPEPHQVLQNNSNVTSAVSNVEQGVDIATKTRRLQPRSNTKNDRVPYASKSSRIKNKEVEIEEHHMTFLLSKNKKRMLSECNNIKLAIRNDKSEIMCTMFPVTLNVIQICLWCINSGCSKHMTGNLKLLINFVWKFLGTIRFGNDHFSTILGFDDLQWGNILITRVYFVKGLGYNLFSVGQFCDSDLKVAFRRNNCFVKNLKGVDLLKGNRITNLYTINLHDMASASLICLMARVTSTKSWLWHQRLSHLNFDTINDLAENDLVTGLPKFK
nr:retrovirus-related Pol polyprotein from transposon TNT 1-94 [Tanacetum cinerariifolium]